MDEATFTNSRGTSLDTGNITEEDINNIYSKCCLKVINAILHLLQSGKIVEFKLAAFAS